MNKDVNDIFQIVINEFECNPVDIFNNGGGPAETHAITQLMKKSYLRTIHDINDYFPNNTNNVDILEIGSWLGVVAVTLKRIGFNISVQEIDEFLSQKNLQKKYNDEEIPFHTVNLRNYKLPYDDNTFHCIVMCEVLEHLNFNPLPVLNEINRILKPGGLLYLAIPNLAFLPKRLKFIFGKSIHDPISFFSNQLLPSTSAIVGIHWREYTKMELFELLKLTGFVCQKHYYFHNATLRSNNPIRRSFIDLLYTMVPSFLPNQTLFAIKQNYLKQNYSITGVT